ncbi:hypothetical protein FQA47_004031 [Oryzias melastigma]|uniref:Uncharacterized protein n=1 Tax=Oryzias melastigma TaxID=30732 RepID=A0A834BX03_ORYME|nr:hypothetical protein FQA47_004031 [Oryzias melastigma]
MEKISPFCIIYRSPNCEEAHILHLWIRWGAVMYRRLFVFGAAVSEEEAGTFKRTAARSVRHKLCVLCFRAANISQNQFFSCLVCMKNKKEA